jgi:hypothetical protein
MPASWRAAGYLARIDRLFRCEARARRIAMTNPDTAARVATWRARFSGPVMRALFAQAITDGLTVPPKSALGIARGYVLGQRASLERCVTTRGGYLDNNGAENAIRPLKLGAKNWLFIGHPGAGPRGRSSRSAPSTSAARWPASPSRRRARPRSRASSSTATGW